MGKFLSAERLALAEKCLDEGWSFMEITRTHHIGYVTLRKYFPGRGWTFKEGAKLGYVLMKHSRNVNHV